MTRTSLLRGEREVARGDPIRQTGEAGTLQEILHSTLFRIRERLSHSGKSCQELATTIQGSRRHAARFLSQQSDLGNIPEFLHVAAVHLHEDQDQIQRVLRNMDVEQIQQIFATTQKQVADLHQKELYVMHGQQSWKESPPKSCTPLHKDIYKQCTAKVYVFSDSVLCLGGKYNILNQQEFGKQDRLCNFVSTPEYRELDNLTGEPFVLEWNIFPGPTTTQLLQEVQKLMEDGLKIHPQNFEDRIIFVSMYNDTDWSAKNNSSMSDENASRVSDNAKKFPMGYWIFSVLKTKIGGTARSPTNSVEIGIEQQRS